MAKTDNIPSKIRKRRWCEDDDVFLRQNIGTMSHQEMADAIDRTRNAVRGRVHILGLGSKKWITDEERRLILDTYSDAGDYRPDVEWLASKIGRSKDAVYLIASRMGLGKRNRLKQGAASRTDNRKFKGDKAALSKAISDRTKKYIEERGHPRGMAGKKHSTETLQNLSRISSKRWRKMTDKERLEHTNKSVASRKKNGFYPPDSTNRKWKSGWRDVGDRRHYFRSMWEANYARYLEWLRNRGEIKDWQYEPKTFWFDQIKRGVRSYKPDFLVTETSGKSVWHEVKGWMDSRSKTALKRMAKYYPDETIIVVDEAAYRSIRLQVMRLVPNWEDSDRDRRT